MANYKKLLALVLVIILVCSMLLTGCNRQTIDLTYSYERAIVCLPNGDIVEGKLTSWRDYDGSDQIQVKIDGKSYLVHSSNVVLISE